MVFQIQKILYTKYDRGRKEKMAFIKRSFGGVSGLRTGCCRKCHGIDESRNYDDMRALYVRFAGKFERIGSLFEKCGHVEIDKEKYCSLVSVDEGKIREKWEKKEESFDGYGTKK